MLQTILISAVSAVSYSIIFYAKKKGSLEPEDFKPFKFASTLLVGLAVGLAFLYLGNPITEKGIQTQLAAYTGVIAVVESILKTIYRKWKKMKNSKQ